MIISHLTRSLTLNTRSMTPCISRRWPPILLTQTYWFSKSSSMVHLEGRPNPLTMRCNASRQRIQCSSMLIEGLLIWEIFSRICFSLWKAPCNCLKTWQTTITTLIETALLSILAGKKKRKPCGVSLIDTSKSPTALVDLKKWITTTLFSGKEVAILKQLLKLISD